MRSFPCAIAVHGGAGITRAAISSSDEKHHLAVIKQSLTAGHKLLKAGASALDAVEAAVVLLEDSPLFNAGHGAVYTADETHELDAAMMDGRTLAAGGVSNISVAKNPIKVARLVMEKTKHVLLTSLGADAFAKKNGADIVEQSYFHVEQRLQQLHSAKKSNSLTLDHEIPQASLSALNNKFGTVGAVAVDCSRNLAAATSTGGMTNKMSGRVGDTALIGAGTYAENSTLAISCTGRGEDFIRLVISHSVAMRMRLLSESLAVATKKVMKTLPDNCGGFVAINNKAQIVMPFNTEGMFRGSIDKKGDLVVKCF